MRSKLGGHFMQNGDPQRWIDAGAAVYKFAPEVLGASAAVPVGPIVVGKLDQFDPALNLTDWKALMKQGHTPQSAADLRFLAQTNIYTGPNKPPVNRYTANPRIDVWEDDNEVPPDNATEAAWYSDYCIAMMRHYEGIDARRANFSFAVGTPDMVIWPHLLPAVRYARDNGHYIGLHEYLGYEADYGVGWKQVDGNRQPTTDVWHGRPDKVYPWGWAALRYRYIYDTVFAPAGLGDVQLLITELGCDSVESVTPAGMPVGTWKEHALHWYADGDDPDERYASMLTWYDDRLREDSYAVGATVFTVGSVGIWKNWDIAGTDVESILLVHIPNAADEDDMPIPPTPPPDTEPPTIPMSNLLFNPSFELDWHDAADFPGHIPDGWTVRYNFGAAYPNPYGQPYKNGEAVKKHRGNLPPDEQAVFVWDGDWTYKVFGGGTKSFWFEMSQTVTAPAGDYEIAVPVWVDHYHWHGYKNYGVDPNQAQVMIVANGVSTGRVSVQSGGRREVAYRFAHGGGPLAVTIHLISNWDINGNFWIDGLSLSPVTVAPPVEPGPGKYTAIIVKAPQDVTAAEWQTIAAEAYKHKHDMTASHDTMLAILAAGNSGSYVKAAYPERQAEHLAMVTAAGYTWQPLWPPEPPAPLVADTFRSPVGTAEERERGDLWLG